MKRDWAALGLIALAACAPVRAGVKEGGRPAFEARLVEEELGLAKSQSYYFLLDLGAKRMELRMSGSPLQKLGAGPGPGLGRAGAARGDRAHEENGDPAAGTDGDQARRRGRRSARPGAGANKSGRRGGPRRPPSSWKPWNSGICHRRSGCRSTTDSMCPS